jgi:hypothetical protein
VIFLVSGCAATPKIQQKTANATDLSSYDTVQVVVEASQQIRKRNGYEATAAELMGEFTEHVRTSGKYVIDGAEASKGKVLAIALTITELNYVHGATRGVIGIMGGRAVLNVTMTVKDKVTGDVLSVVSARDASNHAQGMFSSTTSRQISAIAKELSSKL